MRVIMGYDIGGYQSEEDYDKGCEGMEEVAIEWYASFPYKWDKMMTKCNGGRQITYFRGHYTIDDERIKEIEELITNLEKWNEEIICYAGNISNNNLEAVISDFRRLKHDLESGKIKYVSIN
jgi:hypothetical protein